MDNEEIPDLGQRFTRLLPRPQPKPSSGLSLAPPPKKRRLWLWIVGYILGLAVILAGGSALAYGWYTKALEPVSSELRQVAITIEPGQTSEQIAHNLEAAGIVRSGLATQIYMRLKNANIQSGHYVLEVNQSTPEIVEWLVAGRVDTFKVTIIPGQTIQEVQATLINHGFDKSQVEAALRRTYKDHPLFADVPDGQGLEGYIYPDTYFVATDSSPADLLMRTFDEFEAKIEANNVRERLQQRGFTLHQGVTLASMVGAEVSGNEDRRKVAQVFEARLQRGMVLGSDVTFEYGAQLLGVDPSPSIDSPYNTRRFPGLPPGPIGNFTVEPLFAVVDPSPTDYLYFVSGDDGVTYFSRSAEEHEANVQQYCRKLCGLE